MRQTTLTEQRRPLIKCACDKLTSTFAKWIAKSCKPINIVEDEGFTEVLRVATGDSSIKAPHRRTIMTKIHELYEAEKKKKANYLATTKHVALTGDHWTSVSNDNYLGVTAHLNHQRMEVKVVYTNVHENRRAPLCRGMCRIVQNCCKQLGN